MKPVPYIPRTIARRAIEKRLARHENLKGELKRHLQTKPDDLDGAALLFAQLRRAKMAVPRSHWQRVDAARLRRCRNGGGSTSGSEGVSS